MSELLTVEEAKLFLELPLSDSQYDQLLSDLTDSIEAILEDSKNRTFASAGGSVTAILDGNGEQWLYLDRPVQTLTQIKIGIDPANPTETITPGVTTVIAQSRRLFRQDGGVFPEGVANVHVTYTPATSLSLAAKQAVREGVALVFRSRGSEDATMEVVSSFTHMMRKSFDELPSWKAIPRRPVLV